MPIYFYLFYVNFTLGLIHTLCCKRPFSFQQMGASAYNCIWQPFSFYKFSCFCSRDSAWLFALSLFHIQTQIFILFNTCFWVYVFVVVFFIWIRICFAFAISRFTREHLLVSNTLTRECWCLYIYWYTVGLQKQHSYMKLKKKNIK